MTNRAALRRDPLVISWLLKCEIGQLAHIDSVLRADSRMDAEIVDTIQAFPNGKEVSQTIPHQVGDYFADIQVDPASSNNGAATLGSHSIGEPMLANFGKT